MNSVTWDWPLFEALNFDGGASMDAVMSAISGVVVWVPLYLLIIYMVWRNYSWRGLLLFLIVVALSMGLADMFAGIFKHTGLLKDVWPSLPARPRPMFTDGLVDMHVPSFDHGQYGTVSAHAATIVALTLLSAAIVGRRWFTLLMTLVAVLVCYSRIYLACHFPQDILLGCVVGAASALVGLLIFRYIYPLLAK
ncbi:MAG: phosphatase PAP2 family protein [Alistipes sp.]|nr:phosphatase PAP2 family protein [Alistipes sp.]